MSVTIILIIITVGISLYAWQNESLMHKWIFQPYAVQRDNSWYRFITSGFLHADFTHLLFNMFTFYFFGQAVEQTFIYVFGPLTGILLFLLIYLGGIIVSDIPTFLKHRNDPPYRALGASGGVSSVVFSSILFYPTQDICLYGLLCIPGFILGVLYIMYSYFSGKRMGDNINHDAHLYGAVYGFLLSIVLVPRALPLFFEQISNWSLF
ncbi:membrane associated rhomboid family serine protease [Pontibacter ummariensis]|uniref:Membrane associated serine protease, rhomboid family n=1 Tax=Pontibacter ummariensis TaxID=1610492 RepID=A0A239CH14_9BACT|nr:rhomboid family intramembrane serine protease [Pontibacter ummariensis]PRY15014.1 membrane associated rhomboid family serine protease [Pontibacter ummariensis]SNS19505.1 Membrane associated serine protease, rhomboid family [Pontibacter ummariensis]